jgi:hypothetical protein
MIVIYQSKFVNKLIVYPDNLNGFYSIINTSTVLR